MQGHGNARAFFMMFEDVLDQFYCSWQNFWKNLMGFRNISKLLERYKSKRAFRKTVRKLSKACS